MPARGRAVSTGTGGKPVQTDGSAIAIIKIDATHLNLHTLTYAHMACFLDPCNRHAAHIVAHQHTRWEFPSPNGANALIERMTTNPLPNTYMPYFYTRHFGNASDYPGADYRVSVILHLAKRRGRSWDTRLPLILL